VCSAGIGLAKTPPEVLKPYKAYRAALETKDSKAAKKHALEAWEMAEKMLGDHKITGDLAMNYASISPDGSEKNPYRNYEKRARAYQRAIKLSKFYGENFGETEVQRRIDLVDLELTVTRHKLSSLRGNVSATRGQIGKITEIQKLEKAIERHDLIGSTFDADLQVLFARYYEVNSRPEKALIHSDKALEIYKNRTDDYFSKYEYFIRIFKGNSHYNLDEKIKAALEYQVLMQNLEGQVPADHPVVNLAFKNWMKTRSELEDAGRLEEAETAGLCECWPFENYKDKAVPLKRVPPRMPSSARRSGHVYVTFDVDPDGTPENIEIVSSSSKKFEQPALKSVEKWQYSKLEPDADPENRKGISTKIVYRLRDRSGNIIPE
jgi:TonB family protein